MMLPRDIWECSLQNVATDFFIHNNWEYLIIADTFSKYPFIYKTTSKAADTIIQKFKVAYITIWIPKIVKR